MLALIAVLAALVIDVGSDWWILLVALVIPVIVELLTKANAPAKVKGALAIVAAAIVGLVQLVTDSKGVVFDDALRGFFITFATQLLAYLGIYKPLGLPGTLAPNSGLGSPAVDGVEGSSGDVVEGTVPEDLVG